MNDNTNDAYMNNRDPALRPNRPARKRGGRFLRVLLITLAVLLFLVAGGLFAYAKLMGRDADLRAMAEALGSNLKDGGSLAGAFSGVPAHTNVFIMGTDEDGTRTDVMMVATFDREAETISLLSLPRDTYVTMPQSRRDILAAHDVWPPAPASGVMKLNAVHHYAGEKYGVEFAVKQAEELLGIEIEYFVKVDLEAFRFIVDEIGGVEFDVPQRMYYNDASQGLYIDLYPGLQTLSGKQAEGLVRYRKSDEANPISKGYANGDVQRAEVQQAFVKALVSQLLKVENLPTAAPAMFSTFINYMQTNFNPVDLPKYLGYAKSLNADSIYTYTLPGAGKTINGVSYFIHDEAQTVDLADRLFRGAGGATPAPASVLPLVSSTGLSIQVLNGGSVRGLARRTHDELNAAGFTVDDYDDHQGARTAYTRIIVSAANMGADLQALFPESQIEVTPTALNGYDIVIILGTDAE